tara:strand:- start:214 stop:1830 length:1617 start_codon:yes stop_codon:yes gene_type:complete
VEKTDLRLETRNQRFMDMEEEDSDINQLTFSFSSEQPVRRHFGDEVLSHKEGDVDLSRLNTGGLLLFNHNRDQVLGRINEAWLDGDRARATIRWASNSLAKEIRKDTENGIYSSISVGYQINEMEQQEDGSMRATSWTPHEISIVTIPADTSIGIGRSNEQINSINPMTQHNVEPINTFHDEFSRESEEFSLIKAAQQIASGRGLSGREREVTEEIEHRTGSKTSGFYLPSNGWQGVSTRAYKVGTASLGGNLVATNKMPDMFIDVIRNQLAVTQLGARTIEGLPAGNIEIPRRTSGATAYFIAGDGDDSVTESTGAFDTVNLTPKTVGCFSKFSRLMEMQALPEVESLLRGDMIEAIAQKIDLTAINGSGSSNQPTGILQTTGIGSVALATNGAAASVDNLIDLKGEVAVDSADQATAGFLINAKVEKALSKLKDSDNRYLLDPYASYLGEASLCGRRVVTSNNVPSNLTKGSGSNLSAIIYGDFSQLMIAMFSNVEVLVDPYSDFASGKVGIRALASFDIGIRQPSAFAAIVDAVA